MALEILLPPLGESISEATLVAWLKQPGEMIARDEDFAVVSTDKVETALPSPGAGILLRHLFEVGATVPVGATLAVVGEAGEEWTPPPVAELSGGAPAGGPAAGGLATGLIIKYYAAEARGHGVPVVMEAVAVNRARLGTHVALAKGAAAAICIGTGFSLGRIGPLILMASTFGSEVGQRMGLSVEDTRTMVGCGAAAALTTAFNAPLGGVIFAIELIVTEFRTRSFIPLVVATVIATAVARAIKGDISAFDSLPPYSLNSPLEYPLYLVLGLLAGLAATGFIKLLFGFDRLMTAMHQLPLPAQTALGGLTVGAIALAFPEILGNGFDITHGMLQGTADTARLRGPGGLLTHRRPSAPGLPHQ